MFIGSRGRKQFKERDKSFTICRDYLTLKMATEQDILSYMRLDVFTGARSKEVCLSIVSRAKQVGKIVRDLNTNHQSALKIKSESEISTISCFGKFSLLKNFSASI